MIVFYLVAPGSSTTTGSEGDGYLGGDLFAEPPAQLSDICNWMRGMPGCYYIVFLVCALETRVVGSSMLGGRISLLWKQGIAKMASDLIGAGGSKDVAADLIVLFFYTGLR